MGMSQEKLGRSLSLTFQQIQKYERGANRIGAGRLFRLGQILDVPVAFFYDDMPPEVKQSYAKTPGFAEPGQDPYEQKDEAARRETLELVRAYYRIRPEEVRLRMFDLVKSVGSEAPAKIVNNEENLN
jgi:transcriptional regulator with XRE-family HTH domain